MYLCSSIKHRSPRGFQSADLINKFHRTNRQQGPAAGRARVDYGGEEKQNMKEREGVRDKKAIGMRNEGFGQQKRKDTELKKLIDQSRKKHAHKRLKQCFKFRSTHQSRLKEYFDIMGNMLIPFFCQEIDEKIDISLMSLHHI